MKRLVIALVFAFGLAAPNTSDAAAKPSKNPNSPYMPQVPNKPANKPAEGNEVKGAGTQSGVIKSISTDANGGMIDIYIKISGSAKTMRVRGCGASSAAQPLLNWAFQNRRLVYLNTDSKGCFSGANVTR
ncbi:MAG TPA: hypothetical protein ENJ18_01965 [Nannocystis exedens]|nr:hypothetical protein [Nannocystis exedens]